MLVTGLVPGDVVELRLGDIVPADVRLLSAAELECDESILTGESMPIAKDPTPAARGATLGELPGVAMMGTVVHSGSGWAVVVAAGASASFGRIAAGLRGRPAETAFQLGLRRFSMLPVYVAAVLTTGIFMTNVVLHRPLLDALLFFLAIAVGITPQLLPAVVSTSLAAGSRQLAKKRVLVKRLVYIENLGDVDTLCTDKTGTLTQGRQLHAGGPHRLGHRRRRGAARLSLHRADSRRRRQPVGPGARGLPGCPRSTRVCWVRNGRANLPSAVPTDRARQTAVA